MANGLRFEFVKKLPSGFELNAALIEPPREQSVTILFGPSGAGKTMTLRCLAGLEKPDRGVIKFGEQVWFDSGRKIFVPPQERKIGYLSQEYALFPHLSVRQNLAYGIRQKSRRERARIVVSLLERFLLRDHEKSHPVQLSGGQRQRLALARTLATQPRLLLLDEPLSALDAPTRENLRVELRSLLVKSGLPAMLVTHDRTEAIALGDRMVIMLQGKIEQAGEVEAVFGQPANSAIAAALGVETILPCHALNLERGLVALQAGPVRIFAVDPGYFPEGELLLCLRAEEVSLERGISRETSARNHLPGRIVSLSTEGALIRVRLDCGVPMLALLTRNSVEEMQLTAGEKVTATFKATAVHLIQRGARAENQPGPLGYIHMTR
jgi:molybdate transport system ATP-binding protein